jgi:putative endonuclease
MFAWFKTLFAYGVAADPAGLSATARAGAAGERVASDFLQRKCGFSIVTRNWHSPRDKRDELDLVCRDGEVLVFVEVKTRASHALVPGYYEVNSRKKKALRRACSTYLRALGSRLPQTYRFDIVEISTRVAGGPPEIRHFENVPLFPKDFV